MKDYSSTGMVYVALMERPYQQRRQAQSRAGPANAVGGSTEDSTRREVEHEAAEDSTVAGTEGRGGCAGRRRAEAWWSKLEGQGWG